jgi:hypothetical protein
MIEQWLNEQPDATAKTLFQRLQTQTQIPFAAGQLRTLQRRVKEWRTAIARRLVLGASAEAEQIVAADATAAVVDPPTIHRPAAITD